MTKKKSKSEYVHIGYFLESNREFVRDEIGRMFNLFDTYVYGHTNLPGHNIYPDQSIKKIDIGHFGASNFFETAINSFGSTNQNTFLIDFSFAKNKRPIMKQKKINDLTFLQQSDWSPYSVFNNSARTIIMEDILKQAAKDGVISQKMASSFKPGIITAPLINGKIDWSDVQYERHKKLKPTEKPRS